MGQSSAQLPRFASPAIPLAMKRSCLTFILLFVSVSARGEATNQISVDELRKVRLPDVTLDSVPQIKGDPQKKQNAAPYVQVKGVIGEHIRFELLLPDSWNGRFVMGGGGGFVGSIQNAARDSVNRGYATVGTDTGHTSVGVVATWAHDDPEAKVNFGFLAVHRTAQVAQAITRAYYAGDISYSYFVGCSLGG